MPGARRCAKSWRLDSHSPILGAVDVGTSKICTLIGQKKSSAIEVLGSRD